MSERKPKLPIPLMKKLPPGPVYGVSPATSALKDIKEALAVLRAKFIDEQDEPPSQDKGTDR